MNYLDDESQKILRESNTISSQEVAAKLGDIYLAINVIDGTKRTIHLDFNILESMKSKKSRHHHNPNQKRILKG